MSQIPPLIFELESDNEDMQAIPEPSRYDSIQNQSSQCRNSSSLDSNEDENDDLTPMSPNKNSNSIPIEMAQSTFSFLDHTERSVTPNRGCLNSSSPTQLSSTSSASCNASTQTIPLSPLRCPSCHAFVNSSTSVERARTASSYFCDEHTMELNASPIFQRHQLDSLHDNFSIGSTGSMRGDGRTKPHAVVNPFLVNSCRHSQHCEIPVLNEPAISSFSPSHQQYASSPTNHIHIHPNAFNNFSAGTSPRSPHFILASPYSDPQAPLYSRTRHPPSRYSVGVFGAAGGSPRLNSTFTASPATYITNVRHNPQSHSQTRPLSMIELERRISDVLCEMGDELMPSMAVSQSTPSRLINFRLITSVATGVMRRFSLSSSNSREAAISPHEAVRRSSVCESINRNGSFSQLQQVRNRTHSASYAGLQVETRHGANEPNLFVDIGHFDRDMDEVDG